MDALDAGEGDEARALVADDPDDGVADPEGEDGDDGDAEREEGLLGVGVLGELRELAVLDPDDVGQAEEGDEVPVGAEEEPGDGGPAAAHGKVAAGVEVGDDAREEEGVDDEGAGELVGGAEAAEEVGDEHGAGEGVVGVAVVAQAEDVRARVLPVLVGHVRDHAAEVGQAREHVHVEGEASLFVVSGEKFRFAAV